MSVSRNSDSRSIIAGNFHPSVDLRRRLKVPGNLGEIGRFAGDAHMPPSQSFRLVALGERSPGLLTTLRGPARVSGGGGKKANHSRKAATNLVMPHPSRNPDSTRNVGDMASSAYFPLIIPGSFGWLSVRQRRQIKLGPLKSPFSSRVHADSGQLGHLIAGSTHSSGLGCRQLRKGLSRNAESFAKESR